MNDQFILALKNSLQSERDFVDLLSLQLQAMEFILKKSDPELWEDYQLELFRLLKERNFAVPDSPVPDDL